MVVVGFASGVGFVSGAASAVAAVFVFLVTPEETSESMAVVFEWSLDLGSNYNMAVKHWVFVQLHKTWLTRHRSGPLPVVVGVGFEAELTAGEV